MSDAECSSSSLNKTALKCSYNLYTQNTSVVCACVLACVFVYLCVYDSVYVCVCVCVCFFCAGVGLWEKVCLCVLPCVCL